MEIEEAKSRSKEKKIRPYEDILIFPEDIKDPKVTHQKKYKTESKLKRFIIHNPIKKIRI